MIMETLYNIGQSAALIAIVSVIVGLTLDKKEPLYTVMALILGLSFIINVIIWPLIGLLLIWKQ